MKYKHSRVERIDATGAECRPALPQDITAMLRDGESVHRELRPDIGDDYVAQIQTILNEGGWLTQLVDRDKVRAIAVWRTFHTTYCGNRFEIDDLVTADTDRSRGYGATLVQWLEDRAVRSGCATLTLNSALHRVDAHRFYERHDYEKFGFHFSKLL